MYDVIYTSATALAREIRSRTISAEEVIDTYLHRLDVVNPRINAVIQRCDAVARQSARHADVALAHAKTCGPLHGIPMTISDGFDTIGVITSGGTLGRTRYVPQHEATIVARLRAAGAILIGKTNTPELELAYETDNLIYGRTNNPYDLDCTCGGSSGGAAATVAVGGSAFDIGNDVGGGICLPAHFCGVAGLRPTMGRIPRTGMVWPLGGLLDSLIQPGPLARSVEDLWLLFSLIAGSDWQDPSVIPMPVNDPTLVDIRHLRVAVHTNDGLMDARPQTVNGIYTAAQALLDAGLYVDEKRPTVLNQSIDLFFDLLDADTTLVVEALLRKHGSTRCHPWLQAATAEHPNLSPHTLTSLISRLEHFRSTMLMFMQKFDIIICPPCAFVAPPHNTWRDPDKRRGFGYAAAYSLAGWPSVVVRCGETSDHLPIGLQIIARPWCEDAALAIAWYLEDVFGGWQPSTLFADSE